MWLSKKTFIYLNLFLAISFFVPNYSLGHDQEECLNGILHQLIGVPNKILEASFVKRYWSHPDVKLISATVAKVGSIDTDKPFRIFMKTSELNNTLEVNIGILASKKFIDPYVNVVRLNVNSKKFDSTLPKFITGIIRGLQERKTINPALKEIIIKAPGVVNKTLIDDLKALGFVSPPNRPDILKTRVNAKGQALELRLKFEEP